MRGVDRKTHAPWLLLLYSTTRHFTLALRLVILPAVNKHTVEEEKGVFGLMEEADACSKNSVVSGWIEEQILRYKFWEEVPDVRIQRRFNRFERPLKGSHGR